MRAQHVSVRHGVYHDSVTLLRLSQTAASTPGMSAAQVAMATPLNLELAAGLGFSIPAGAGPNDLLITISGTDDTAVDTAMANPFLLASLSGLRSHLARARRLAQDNPARLSESVSEHLLIVQAILDRDEMLAAQATAVHLRKSLANLLDSADAFGASDSSSTKGTP